MMEPKKQKEMPSVPGFTLMSCCGRGTVGEVWLGADRKERLLAIRLVSKRRNPFLLAAERRGVLLYHSLSGGHMNLMKILDAGETADYLYSVMEPADNIRSGQGSYEPDTLDGRLFCRRLTFEWILGCLDSILKGMIYLHGQGVVHGDLKPENIIFVNRILKIGDPGLASPANARCPGGTAGFRPPWNAPGWECDIYAFGKMIYMLCTRENPQRFPDIPESCNLSAYMPLNEIALGCCDSNPHRRFRDADEIRRELNRVRSGRSSFYGLCRRAE